MAETPPPETAEELVEGVVSRLEPFLDDIREAGDEVLRTYLSFDGILLVAVVVGAGVLAWFASPFARTLLGRVWPARDDGKQPGFRIVDRLVFPMLWISTVVLEQAGMPVELPRIVASLLNAWVVIRLFASFVGDPLWSKTFATLAWTIAALNILRLLNPTIAMLDSVGISMGETRLTLYMVLKGAMIAAVLIWAAGVVSSFVQGRVQRSRSLTPSVQTLIAQTTRIALLFMAVLLALNVIGIDLTALAVFSGAIGIGIGFGLQAIFSNLVSGLILLFEGSIKVGDFVELDSGVTGEVREIGIRATRVTTNDNIDILVPNAEFINKNVTNWTLREGHRRARISFGVAYGTDKELVRAAALEAASTVPHELKGPGARSAEVWLVGFGESSLDFELVIWLSPEAVKRPSRVNADYNWALETALKKYGIEIPFPQRDLHVRSGRLPVRIEPTD